MTFYTIELIFARDLYVDFNVYDLLVFYFTV